MNARSTSFEFTCLGKRINDIVSAIFHSVMFNRCFGKFSYKYENSYSIGTLGFEEVICDFIDFTYIRVASHELVKAINQHIKSFVDELRMLAMMVHHQQQHGRPASSQVTSPSQAIPQSAPGLTLTSAFRRPSSLLDMGEPSPHHSPFGTGHHHRFSQHDLALLSPLAAATGSISLEFLIKNKNHLPFPTVDSLVWEIWTLKVNWLKDDVNESLYNKTSIEDQLFDKILSIVSIVNSSNAYLPQTPSASDVDQIYDISYPDAQPYNFKISYKIGKDANEVRRTSGMDRGGLLGHDKLRNFLDKLSL